MKNLSLNNLFCKLNNSYSFNNGNNTKTIWKRSQKIENYFINQTVQIHNGRSFYTVLVKKEMLGLTFGSFSFTRSKATHISKKEKKSKKK